MEHNPTEYFLAMNVFGKTGKSYTSRATGLNGRRCGLEWESNDGETFNFFLLEWEADVRPLRSEEERSSAKIIDQGIMITGLSAATKWVEGREHDWLAANEEPAIA